MDLFKFNLRLYFLVKSILAFLGIGEFFLELKTDPYRLLLLKFEIKVLLEAQLESSGLLTRGLNGLFDIVEDLKSLIFCKFAVEAALTLEFM